MSGVKGQKWQKGRRTPSDTHTPVTALRIPRATLAQADALVGPLAASGTLVNPTRSTVLRMAIVEGLRVLARRYPPQT